MKKLGLIIVSLFIISCGNDSDDCNDTAFLPPPNYFQLKLEDTNGNSLIGNLFIQDSFKLSNANSILYIKPLNFGPDDELIIPFNSIDSGADYFLDLSETDTDTLNISHSLKTGECNSYESLDQFTYNSDLLFDNGIDVGTGIYPVIKD